MDESKIEVPDEICPLPLGVSEINSEIPIMRMCKASSRFEAVVDELNLVDQQITKLNNSPVLFDSPENKKLKIWKLRLKRIILDNLKIFLNNPNKWLSANADPLVN